jgi:formylglycine-generating enzyme required for sulfatase activity
MGETQGLTPGAVLHNGTYKIERVLGQGGFGITYLATDLSLDRLVAIKEFFPKEYCDREATTSHVTLGTKGNEDFVHKMKAKFLKEARNIAKLGHPGIIKIHAAFEENNTAYYVMEYIEGGSLSERVKRDGPLSEAKAVAYLTKVGHALEYVHERKINHLDVKPANIMVRREDDEPILIDFGLSKQYDEEGNQTSTTPTGISHGYAPIEQYNAGGVKEFSPQTDIYSLGATLYYLLSGVVPPQSTSLISESLTFPVTIPSSLVSVISKAMSPNKNNRQSSVREFLDGLSATSAGGSAAKQQKTVTEDTVFPEGTRTEPEEKPKETYKSTPSEVNPENNSRVKWIVSILAVALVVGVIFLIPGRNNNSSSSASGDLQASQSSSANKNSFTVNGVSFDMVNVEGGTFKMGSDDSEAYDDEKPVHSETVSTFRIGKTEVTQALWKAVMGSNPSYFKGDNLPVECVSWHDCQTFIDKLNSITGENFRLPTESEWEYAARGGNKSRGYKYSGSNSLGEVAWYAGNSGNKTHSVATKSPNELGIYDMTGNVWEWTSDIWCDDYNSSRVGSNRVNRGGSWDFDARYCRVSFRNSNDPSNAHNDLGLRLAL